MKSSNRGVNRETQCTKPDQGTHHCGAEGQTTAHVRLDIGNGIVVTASITNEAVDELALTPGDEAIAVIKASDVMIAK